MRILKLLSIFNYCKFSVLPYTLFLIPIIYFTIFGQWRKYKLQKKLGGFYTFPSLPIIGHIHYVSGTMRDRVRKVLQHRLKAKFPLVAWIFHIPIFVVGSPEDIQIVLNTSNSRRLLDLFKYVFKNEGILWGNREKWQKSRRLMNPAFSAIMLQQYLIVFNEQAEILANKISSVANTDKLIDMWPFMTAMNLDTITQNIADYKLNLQTTQENGFSQALEMITKLESMRLTKPWLLSNFIYNLYLLFTGNWNIYKQIKELPQQIVEKKVQDYALNKSKYQTKEREGKTPKTVIDVLMKFHDVDPEYAQELLQIDIGSMIGAGSETTAITSCFTTLMLAMHPQTQEKAYQEVRSVFGEKPKTIQIEHINQLIYLEKCIKETLRLFPPVPLTVRQHEEDIKLSKKATIPANCHILVPFYIIHHSQEYYPNPEAWIPERFDPEIITNQQKNVFMAFGAGPRMCIGMKYAMISLKTQMAYILNSYRFTTDLKMEDIKLTADITLRNDEGYLVKVWSR